MLKEVLYIEERTCAREVITLFKVAELNGPLDDEERIENMIKEAQYILTARVHNQLVGLIRVLTDFSYNVFIADLAVLPEFQNKRIGIPLLNKWLVEVLPKGNTSYQWTLVISGINGIFIGLFLIILVIMYPLSPIKNMKKPKVKSQIKVTNYKPVILMLVLATLVGCFSLLGIRLSTIILVNHFKLPVTDMGILVSIDKILSILGIVVLARYIKSEKEAKIAGILMIVVLPLQIVGAFQVLLLLLVFLFF